MSLSPVPVMIRRRVSLGVLGDREGSGLMYFLAFGVGEPSLSYASEPSVDASSSGSSPVRVLVEGRDMDGGSIGPPSIAVSGGDEDRSGVGCGVLLSIFPSLPRIFSWGFEGTVGFVKERPPEHVDSASLAGPTFEMRDIRGGELLGASDEQATLLILLARRWLSSWTHFFHFSCSFRCFSFSFSSALLTASTFSSATFARSFHS